MMMVSGGGGRRREGYRRSVPASPASEPRRVCLGRGAPGSGTVPGLRRPGTVPEPGAPLPRHTRRGSEAGDAGTDLRYPSRLLPPPPLTIIMPYWLTSLFPFLEYPFMQRALLVALAIGFLCAVVGVFVTLRSMAFFSDAIAHSALAGIALGILLGIAPVPAAVIFSLVVAVGITSLTYRTSLPSDTVIGVFFSGSM